MHASVGMKWFTISNWHFFFYQSLKISTCRQHNMCRTDAECTLVAPASWACLLRRVNIYTPKKFCPASNQTLNWTALYTVTQVHKRICTIVHTHKHAHTHKEIDSIAYLMLISDKEGIREPMRNVLPQPDFLSIIWSFQNLRRLHSFCRKSQRALYEATIQWHCTKWTVKLLENCSHTPGYLQCSCNIIFDS